MATKKQHTDFNKEVSKYLESIGAEVFIQSQFEMHWGLTTKNGVLELFVHEPERSEVFSIYGRFDDNTNLNFHGYDAHELLTEFKGEIDALLIKETH